MPSYRLLPPQGSETFRRVTSARKWVGRVWQHADGSFRMTVKGTEVGRGSTPREAFENGAAHQFGYGSVAALKHHNRIVRAQNRRRRQVLAAELAALFGTIRR